LVSALDLRSDILLSNFAFTCNLRRHSKAYWDQRYGDGCTIGGTTAKGEVSNEWYVGYDAVKDLLLTYTNRDEKVVLLGCGTSTLGQGLADNAPAKL
jgi:hypothetical protein